MTGLARRPVESSPCCIWLGDRGKRSIERTFSKTSGSWTSLSDTNEAVLHDATNAQQIAHWTNQPIRRAARFTVCLTHTLPMVRPAGATGGEAEWWFF